MFPSSLLYMACLDIPIIAATSLMLFLSSRSALFSCSRPSFANQITPLPIISRTARIRSSPLQIHSSAPISSFPITYHCISAFLSCLFFAFSALSHLFPIYSILCHHRSMLFHVSPIQFLFASRGPASHSFSVTYFISIFAFVNI